LRSFKSESGELSTIDCQENISQIGDKDVGSLGFIDLDGLKRPDDEGGHDG
jgi:hypothetical protein